jgi:hypothetical protein
MKVPTLHAKIHSLSARDRIEKGFFDRIAEAVQGVNRMGYRFRRHG